MNDIKVTAPTNEQAAYAERCGYYAHAKKLWGQVIAQSKKNSLLWEYAVIRRNFCESAVKNGWRRPESRLPKVLILKEQLNG